MQHRFFRTKPIVVGFLLCLFITCVMATTMVHLYHQIGIQLFELQNKESLIDSIEEMRLHCYMTQMTILRYRETNDLRNADNLREKFAEFHRIDVAIDREQPSVEERKIAERISDQMKSLEELLEADIQIGEHLAKEETPERLAERKKIRNLQDQSMDEIETRLAALMAILQLECLNNWQMLLSWHSRSFVLILVGSFSTIMFCGIVCAVVFRLAICNTVASEGEEVSPFSTSQNLRTIVDQLQEIVNSLRR